MRPLHPALCQALRGDSRLALDSRQGSSELTVIVDDACCICLETLSAQQRLVVLPCAHRLHAACAKRWLLATSAPSCPTCRQNIPAPSSAAVSSSSLPQESSRQQQQQRISAAQSNASYLDQGVGSPLELHFFGSPPCEDILAIMTSAACSRELAEHSFQEACSSGLKEKAAVRKALSAAVECLKSRGYALLDALRCQEEHIAESLVALGSFGADLGLRVGWGSAQAGWTALTLAVDQRRYHLAKRLCETISGGIAGRTADVNSRDARGCSALDLANAKGFKELSTLLLAFGADEMPRTTARIRSCTRAVRI
jgi:hypothetical protein